MFADGLLQWIHDRDTLPAEAAGLNLAAILIHLANHVTDGKWCE